MRPARSLARTGPDLGRSGPGRALTGGPLAAWQHGERGPLVVAVHGLAESGRYWNGVVEHLSVGYRVVTIDLLGFGRSPWPELGYSVEAHAEAVAATLGAVTGGEAAVVLAHQAGVPVALAYAARGGPVASIVGLGTPWYRSAMEARRALRGPWWLARWLVEHETRARLLCRTLCGGRPLVPRVARFFATESLPADVVHDAFLHHWASLSGTLASCWTGADLPARYPALPVPVLALHGEEDVAVPVENLHDAAATRPALTVEVVGGRAFNLALEAPELVADAVGTITTTRARGHRGRTRSLRVAPPGELTVGEAAALARCHRRSVLGWVEHGGVRARRVGNRLFVDRASLVEYVFGPDTALAERLMASRWLTTAETAALLGVSHATVVRLVERGLPSHRVRGRRVFLADEVANWPRQTDDS